MCDRKLNFFESKDPYVIGALLNIYIDINDLTQSYFSNNSKLNDKYMWVEGKKNSLGYKKSHGGFVKLLKSKGVKAYILPKIKQLIFNKEENKEYINKLNDIDINNVQIQGLNQTIFFTLNNKIKLLEFELCEEDSDDEEIPELDRLYDNDELIIEEINETNNSDESEEDDDSEEDDESEDDNESEEDDESEETAEESKETAEESKEIAEE